jgi:uncharacterized protein
METQIPRFFQVPKESSFVFGPRGTGKTTFLKKNFSGALWIDLLEPETFRSLSAKPERLIDLTAADPKKTVVIDEIQKLPELLSVIHLLIEKKAGTQFILTGSSARKLKKAGADLLAGRLIKHTMFPFMAAELGAKFSLNSALAEGMIPLVVSAPDPAQVLKSYAALYVREEVQMEGLVRNIGAFSRFLEAISFSHGSVLNVSNVARECEVERKTVEGFISILEDLLLCSKIPVFSRRAKRAVITHNKFYFFDTGVFRSLRPTGPLDKPEEIEGAALEGLVHQHLEAWNSYGSGETRLHYWRTSSGSEVDFILYGPKVFAAIEVKNSGRVRPQDIKSLKAFKEDYPEADLYLLYRGKERIKTGGVLCIPCNEFLAGLIPGKKLPA